MSSKDNFEQLSKEQLIALHRALLAVNRPFRRFDEVVEVVKRETAVLFNAAEVHVQLFDSYWYKEPLEPTERPVLSAPLVAEGKQIGVLSVVRERLFEEDESCFLNSWCEHAGVTFQTTNDMENCLSTISIISIETRVPVTVINNYARLMKLIIPDNPEAISLDKICDFAERIEDHSRYIQDVISNVIDASRLETRRMRFDTQKIEVVNLLKEARAGWETYVECQGSEIKLEVPESLFCLADKSCLEHLLSILVKNAGLHNKSDAKTIAVSAERQGDKVLVQVSDNGIGIVESDVGRVFSKYWRADGSAGRRTGLGLYIARGLVEGMGGEIGVESVEGEGSTFWFTLPLAEDDP